GVLIGNRGLVGQRILADFAREKCLRQRRAHIGKIFLLADEDDAALEAVLTEKRRSLAARLTAADNRNRRSGAGQSLFHHHLHSSAQKTAKAFQFRRNHENALWWFFRNHPAISVNRFKRGFFLF